MLGGNTTHGQSEEGAETLLQNVLKVSETVVNTRPESEMVLRLTDDITDVHALIQEGFKLSH